MKGSDDEMTDKEENGFLEESEENPAEDVNRQRELENLQAYDGSQKECSSPYKIRTFRTASAPSSPGDESTMTPFSFAILGDLGQYPHSIETLRRLMKSSDEVDAIILAGDLAYSELDHRQWVTFLDFLDDFPIVDHKPMQICPGNHDIDKQEEGQGIFIAYEMHMRRNS